MNNNSSNCWSSKTQGSILNSNVDVDKLQLSSNLFTKRYLDSVFIDNRKVRRGSSDSRCGSGAKYRWSAQFLPDIQGRQREQDTVRQHGDRVSNWCGWLGSPYISEHLDRRARATVPFSLSLSRSMCMPTNVCTKEKDGVCVGEEVGAYPCEST